MSTQAVSARSSGKFWIVLRWGLQIAVALAFLGAGAAKLASAPPMVAIFTQIGIGQWFRYVTATVEIVGALLLLWPKYTVYGAGLLACTMVAAIITHLAVIGGNPAPAATLLALNLLILWMHRKA